LVNLSRVVLIVGCGLVINSPAICLAAAASSQTIGNKVSLEVPELIQILSIDGQEGNSHFLGSRAHVQQLTVGEHVLSVRYTQLFNLTADEHDILKSKPMAIRFTAEAGQTYLLSVTPPKRYDAAKEFAKQPDIRLINKTAGTSQQAIQIKSYAEASLVDSIGKAFQSSDESVSKQSDNVQLLQDIWLRATPTERQAFAAWLASKAASAK
jgi:uncharacterized protein YccT (UPF0319 family)